MAIENSKKLTVSILSSSSEVVLADVIEKAGVSSNAATVVRDVNGKVIKIEVNLPESAAAAAKAAIAANSGVASVSDTPVEPDEAICDGSQASLEYLIQRKKLYFYQGEENITYNEDGTFEANLGTYVELRSLVTLPPNPQTGYFEADIKFDAAVGTTGNFYVRYANDGQAVQVTVLQSTKQLMLYTPGAAATQYFSVATEIDADEFFKVRLEANADNTVSCYVNGTLKGTIVGTINQGNNLLIHAGSHGASKCLVDAFAFTHV